MAPARHPLLLTLAVLLLTTTTLAGCTQPNDTDPGAGADETDQPDPDDPTDDRIEIPLHFDGNRAYQLTLQQLYEDPENKTGPRYRIPGSDTTDQVAEELRSALADALEPLNGMTWVTDAQGDQYYDLDLRPVQRFLCAEDDPARDRVRDITFHNVVGRTSPTGIGLIIGAHYDSKRHADPNRDPQHAGEPILGADDGAASSAAVVELARAFAAQDPGIPLTFILFDGEDGFEKEDCHPLAGSLHFAQTMTNEEIETTQGMILLDMIGNESASFLREGYSTRYQGGAGVVDSSWLGDLIWDTASDLDVATFQDRATGAISDDHLPFLHEGIPSVDIIRFDGGFAPYWHTTRDDHTAVQPGGIGSVGRTVELAVHRLAAGDDGNNIIGRLLTR